MQYAEEMNGFAMNWMHKMAEKKNAVLVGSMMMKEAGEFYNRLIWMHPDGRYELYDKRHLFRMGNEHEHYTAGNSRIVFQLNEWKICPLICYDLRFPVWSRNRLVNNEFDYDVLIYVANWPERRAHAWKSLLVARAIENQTYVVGVNRIGSDGNNVIYSGDSAVIDFNGEKLSRTERYGDRCETVTISLDELKKFRSDFPASLDADQFNINL
jgi:predicted amidohydrolase